MKKFLVFLIIWISQNLAIPFWIVGHIHLSVNVYDDIKEILASVGMNLIGYSCWYSVLSRNPVNNVMSVLLLFPVTGLLTSIFVLKETPNTYAYIGGAIIISGVAMILINKNKKVENL